MEAEDLESLSWFEDTTMHRNGNTTLPTKEGAQVLEMELKLNNISHAVDDARLIIANAKKKRHAVETTIRDERMALRAELEEEKELRNSSRRAFLSQVVALQRERNAALRDVQGKGRELECIQKKVYDDRMERGRESLMMKSTMEAEKQKLIAELEYIQKTVDIDRTNRDHEFLAMKSTMEAEKEKLVAELQYIQKKIDDDRMERDRESLAMKSTMKAEKQKLIAELDELKREKDTVQSQADLAKICWEMEIDESIKREDEKTRLETALQEEKEKRLCQICMESPKDTICLPCVHLHYCFACLEKHRQRNRTCPSCRTVLSGVLRSDI